MASQFSKANWPASTGGRSRFLNDFDSTASFQQGVNQSIWTGRNDQPNSAVEAEPIISSVGFDAASHYSLNGDRPGSASAHFTNGSFLPDKRTNFDTSPKGQRKFGSNHSSQSGNFANLASSSSFGRSSLDPTAGSFSQASGIEALQAQVNASSRASSRNRNGSSSGSSFWDFSRAANGGTGFSRTGSQVASRANSQAVSRNNSLPPSRQGGDPSPTEPSFNTANLGSLRSGSFASERPQSQGQYGTMNLPQFSSTRYGQTSSTPGSNHINPMLHFDETNDGLMIRNNSVGSKDLSSGVSRAASQMSNLGIHDPLENFEQTSPYTAPRQILSAGIDPASGCPTLNQVQSRQNSVVSSRGNARYLDHVRQGRSFGQSYPWIPDWQLNGSFVGSTRNGAMNPYNGQIPQDMYDGQLLDRQNLNRASAGRYAHQQAPRSQLSAGRNMFSSASQDLLVGKNWREQIRPNNGQKYIETNQDTRLRDVLGHVARFCGDQAGSRFLQDQLEQANTDDKEMVFKELLPNTIQLCSDPFGNYVIQKFFEHGTQRQKEQLADRMRGKVKDLSMNMYGCRCIQKAFEHVLCDQQAVLVQELKPCLNEVSKDQHGNHVVQKAIERLPREDIDFIIHGYYDKVKEMSQDSYGCRVIQRLLEVEDDPMLKSRLIEEVHKCSLDLVRNGYGNYVVQHVIEHGEPQDRSRLIKAMQSMIVELTNNKFASNVVEKCLRKGTDEERDLLVAKIAEVDPITKKPRYLKSTMLSNFGNYVVQRILKTLTSPKWEAFAGLIQGQLDELVADRNSESKKVAEFQRLLQFGPRDPNAPESDNEVVKSDGRHPRPSISAATPLSEPLRRTNTTSTEDVSSGHPPPLTRLQPSPSSSSTPSTSDSTIDQQHVNPKIESAVKIDETTTQSSDV